MYFKLKEALTKEEQEVIDYLELNQVTIFPYKFQKIYNKEAIEVLFDERNGLRYVQHEGKNVWFEKINLSPAKDASSRILNAIGTIMNGSHKTVSR